MVEPDRGRRERDGRKGVPRVVSCSRRERERAFAARPEDLNVPLRFDLYRPSHNLRLWSHNPPKLRHIAHPVAQHINPAFALPLRRLALSSLAQLLLPRTPGSPHLLQHLVRLSCRDSHLHQLILTPPPSQATTDQTRLEEGPRLVGEQQAGENRVVVGVLGFDRFAVDPRFPGELGSAELDLGWHLVGSEPREEGEVGRRLFHGEAFTAGVAG